MRAIVTGGAGFIGSHVVDSLAARGVSVLVIDDLSSGTEENLSGAQAAGNVELCVEDICSAAARQAVADFQPEIIFHHAAQMNVRRSVEDPNFDAEKNVIGTVNLLEQARVSGVQKFILASTGGAIYGEQSVFPAPESHEISPECPYGVSKRAGELYLEYFSRAGNMTCIALRYANVYGPRQNPKGEAGVVAIFSENLYAGKKLRVNGDGEQTRDFVYVGDIAQANMLAYDKITEPGFYIYNVGRGIETSVLEIVAALKSGWAVVAPESLKDKDVIVEHGPALAGEQRRSVIDPKKICEELGWNASIAIEEGLQTTLESYKSPGSQ